MQRREKEKKPRKTETVKNDRGKEEDDRGVISNDKRQSPPEPDVEIVLDIDGENDTSDTEPEKKKQKPLFTFSEMARKQNRIFVVADIVCTAVFDIVYALVSR